MCPRGLFSPVLPLSLSPKGLFSGPISHNVLLASAMGRVQRRPQEAVTPLFFLLARKCFVDPILSGLSTLGAAPACPGKHPQACSVGSPTEPPVTPLGRGKGSLPAH